MSPLDIIILLIIGGLGVLGFWRGFIKELIETIGAVVAAVISYRLYPEATGWFGMEDSSGWGAKIGLFVGIFIIVMMVISILGMLVRKFIRSIRLGMWDHLLGLILGAIKGGVLVTALLTATLWIGPAGEKLVAESKLARANLLTYDMLSNALPDKINERRLSILGKGISFPSKGIDSSFPLVDLASSITDTSMINKFIVDDNLRKQFSRLISLTREEAGNLEGIVIQWNAENYRGMVQSMAGDSSDTYPIYYGSIKDGGEKATQLQAGERVSFTVVMSPFLHELCAMQVTPVSEVKATP